MSLSYNSGAFAPDDDWFEEDDPMMQAVEPLDDTWTHVGYTTDPVGELFLKPAAEDEEKTVTIRGEVLEEARQLIEGDRNKTYGSPTENFQNTADIWNVLLGHKLKFGEAITPHEVATLMVALKLARTIAQPKRDNFVDMAGYAACGWETLEDTQ